MVGSKKVTPTVLETSATAIRRQLPLIDHRARRQVVLGAGWMLGSACRRVIMDSGEPPNAASARSNLLQEHIRSTRVRISPAPAKVRDCGSRRAA